MKPQQTEENPKAKKQGGFRKVSQSIKIKQVLLELAWTFKAAQEEGGVRRELLESSKTAPH